MAKSDNMSSSTFDKFHELVTASADGIRESLRIVEASEPDRRLARSALQMLGRKRGMLTAEDMTAMRNVSSRIERELASDEPDEDVLALLGHITDTSNLDPHANEIDATASEDDGTE